MENDAGQMFAKGIVSGWMIATMVWMIPSMESAKMWIIILITYLMALGDFTHIVVGSAEVSTWCLLVNCRGRISGWCSPGRRWRGISSVAASSSR
jgi:formate/nitrite transporter FocA (FNT family)